MHSYKISERGKSLEQAGKAIILLHGRGASAEDILSLGEEFNDGDCYLAAPQATNNTWYPYSFLAKEEMNEPWLSSAVDVVKRLIDQTSKYIPAKNIYLMGFSQGACLTLEVAARHAQEYAGVVAFTGGLIGEAINTKKYHGNFCYTKIFIGNSDRDPHVPFSRSEESKTILEQLEAEVTLRVYLGMPHTIIKQELEEVKALIFEKKL